MDKARITEELKQAASLSELSSIRQSLQKIKKSLSAYESKAGGSSAKEDQINRKYLLTELDQILETRTLERTKYYLNRLIKGLTEVKQGKINDLNLNRWKEYEDIITDSLWLIDKRDSSGSHNAGYWGNFIPQIPNQFLKRYTKQGDWVLDTFLGSGTTLIECRRLGRNGIGIELQQEICELAKKNVEKEKVESSNETRCEIVNGNSVRINYEDILERLKIDDVQFVFMHPPYWDIIKFSDDKDDLSNAKSIEEFLESIGRIIDGVYPVLEKGRFLALVIGDKYSGGEWIPLGFYTMQEILKRKFKLKSTIVKNFDETKGKMNQKELWRYRALQGGFYIFKHEYIFLFQKK